MRETQAELERLEGQVAESQEMEQWSNWVKTFRQQIESYRKFNPHQRKEVLQKLLTFVYVHLIENQTHWLEIQFKVPLVGDLLVYKDPKQKALGYSLKDGVTALWWNRSPAPTAKKTNRDNGLGKGKSDFSLPRWSNLAFTFEELQRSAEYHFCLGISIRTMALSWVQVDPAHQALIDRILGLKEEDLNCHQIAAYLNNEGVSSW